MTGSWTTLRRELWWQTNKPTSLRAVILESIPSWAAGACPLLALKLLVHSQMKIVKDAAWTVSNIAAGNTIQIQALITNNVVRPLVSVLGKGDFKCHKEAAWAITNITSGNLFYFYWCLIDF
jgi:hypothetical protein